MLGWDQVPLINYNSKYNSNTNIPKQMYQHFQVHFSHNDQQLLFRHQLCTNTLLIMDKIRMDI